LQVLPLFILLSTSSYAPKPITDKKIEDIVEKNKYSGIKLIKESASQGYLPARIMLSKLYLNGEVGFMGEKKEIIIRDYLLNGGFLADNSDRKTFKCKFYKANAWPGRKESYL